MKSTKKLLAASAIALTTMVSGAALAVSAPVTGNTTGSGAKASPAQTYSYTIHYGDFTRGFMFTPNSSQINVSLKNQCHGASAQKDSQYFHTKVNDNKTATITYSGGPNSSANVDCSISVRISQLGANNKLAKYVGTIDVNGQGQSLSWSISGDTSIGAAAKGPNNLLGN